MNSRDDEPRRDDGKLLAVFETRALAEGARDALLGAGIPAGAIRVIDPHPGRDQVAVAIEPATESERRNVIEVLQGCGPVEPKLSAGSNQPNDRVHS